MKVKYILNKLNLSKTSQRSIFALMYKHIIKPILFLFEPEKAHHITFSLLKVFCKIPLFGSLLRFLFVVKNDVLQKNVFGLQFQNPVGLAAGLDKNGIAIDELSNLGFGFIEIGTVTPLPQAGNDAPRLFRLIDDHALINRMGFNNDGMEHIAKRLANRKSKIILGGNIGKNKITPNENAIDDYLKAYNTLYPYVDYFVVNVSSPNTPGLRALQEKEPLLNLLYTLENHNKTQVSPKPILLKISPDLTLTQLDDIVEIVNNTGIAGLIATNTTIERSNLNTPNTVIESIGAGGLSGAPLKKSSTEIIAYLSNKIKVPIIASGGVMCAQDAIDKIKAGASLVQVYSGFVYNGPALVKEINQALVTYYTNKK